MEIEKRYEINGDIPLDLVESKKYIEQVYSVVGNNKVPDVRIRKTVENDNSTYTHTVKYKTDNKNSRIEIESDISQEDYDAIFKLIDKVPVRKNRYLIPIGNGLTAEVDEFLDLNKIIVEIEFPSEEVMNEFTKEDKKPSWIGKEITEKQSFSVQIFNKLNDKVNIKFY